MVKMKLNTSAQVSPSVHTNFKYKIHDILGNTFRPKTVLLNLINVPVEYMPAIEVQTEAC